MNGRTELSDCWKNSGNGRSTRSRIGEGLSEDKDFDEEVGSVFVLLLYRSFVQQQIKKIGQMLNLRLCHEAYHAKTS